MSTPPNPPSPPSDPPAPPAPPPTDPPIDPPADTAAEIEKWKALARKHEQRAKENAAARARLDELEEASKSELERAQQRAQAAEQRAAALEAAQLRARIGAQHGLPPQMWDRLQGSTEDEITADAAALKALIVPGAPPPPPPPPPPGNGGPGPRGDDDPDPGSMDMDAYYRRWKAARTPSS